MDKHELDAPEVQRFEQTAHDTICFYIKKPYGALTGAITRYQVKWKECGKSEEGQKVFDNPNLTKLEVNGLKNCLKYDFTFESGSRLRFGKSAHKKGILLDNWHVDLFSIKLQDSNALISRLNEWTDGTVKQMLEKVFGDEKSKMFGRRRSSIFSRLSSSVKFCSKLTKGTYLAFLISHKNKVVLTSDKTVPMVRIDKSTGHITDSFMKWFCRLPRHQQDLLTLQRINEECSQNEGTSSSSSLEHELLKTLLTLLMLTSYEKFDFYHYKSINNEESTILIVGARGQGIFVENLQWYSQSNQTQKCELQEELLKIGQFYEQLRKPIKPGLYVADLRLTSDIQQIYVQTSSQLPAFLPCTFIRSNSHLTNKEWSWLSNKVDSREYNECMADSEDQLVFYRQLFQAINELFEQYGQGSEQRMEYQIYNEFLLEYEEVSMILIYPGASNVVSFMQTDTTNPDKKTELIPGSLFEREYLRHLSSTLYEKYCRVRAFIPIFKDALKLEKMRGKRVKIWSKSVSQNLEDAEKMLSRFDSDISWLNKVVSGARKSDTGVKLYELQQQFELFEILSYSQSFANRKAKLNRINVVINFSSLYPPGTTILIQIKSETTAAEIVQVILQRSFTKVQLAQMDEQDFYLAVSCGMRERRLRPSLKLHELDEPWIDGEFRIRQCIPTVSFK